MTSIQEWSWEDHTIMTSMGLIGSPSWLCTGTEPVSWSLHTWLRLKLCTLRVFKVDALIRPSLVRVSVTNTSPEDLNTAPEVINELQNSSTLQKKPSLSSEKTVRLSGEASGFPKKPSSSRQSCAPNAYQKSILNVGIDFKDVYHRLCKNCGGMGVIDCNISKYDAIVYKMRCSEIWLELLPQAHLLSTDHVSTVTLLCVHVLYFADFASAYTITKKSSQQQWNSGLDQLKQLRTSLVLCCDNFTPASLVEPVLIGPN